VYSVIEFLSLLINVHTYEAYIWCTVHTNVGASYIKPEVVFDEADGRGIIDDHVMSENKKAVCRVHGA